MNSNSNYETSCKTGSVKYICTEKKKGCRVSQIMPVCDPTAAIPERTCIVFF